MDLDTVEKKLLTKLELPYEALFVDVDKHYVQPDSCQDIVPEKVSIRTVVVNKSCSDKLPLVYLHGLASGIGTIIFSINKIAKRRPVYALDLPGWGRSTRVQFPEDPRAIQEMYVAYLEAWRISVGLEKFVLVGESFGGYLATLYALQFPERVSHLVGVDPWGYPQRPENIKEILGIENPIIKSTMIYLASQFNIHSPIRALGPLGYPAIKKTVTKFVEYQMFGDDVVEAITDYSYLCAMLNPSGEASFRLLMDGIIYAKRPMCEQLQNLSPKIQYTIFYPESSYVPAIPMEKLRRLLKPENRLSIHVIPKTNHESVALVPEFQERLSLIEDVNC